METLARKSVPLNAKDLHTVEHLRQLGDDTRDALSALGVQVSQNPSEAEAIHTLVEIGSRVLEEKEIEFGYIRAAEFDRIDPERQAWREVMQRRRVRRWSENTQAAGQ